MRGSLAKLRTVETPEPAVDPGKQPLRSPVRMAVSPTFLEPRRARHVWVKSRSGAGHRPSRPTQTRHKQPFGVEHSRKEKSSTWPCRGCGRKSASWSSTRAGFQAHRGRRASRERVRMHLWKVSVYRSQKLRNFAMLIYLWINPSWRQTFA